MGNTERKLTGLKKILLKGKLNGLLIYLKDSKEELSFEVRINGHAKIYYKKCLALDISPTGNFNINRKYFLDDSNKSVISEIEFNKQWEKISQTIAINPKSYFEFIKAKINTWQGTKSNKNEFIEQQKLAVTNRDSCSKYFIVDMEYKLSQSAIPEGSRDKNINIYDLVAVDKFNNSIVLFEVKFGLDAVKNSSGAESHFKKFKNEFYDSDNKITFKSQLKRDVINIIKDKNDLGLINFDCSETLDEIKFITLHVIKDNNSKKEENWYKGKDVGEVIFIRDFKYMIS